MYQKLLILDIETTELENRSVEAIWMVGVKNPQTGEHHHFLPPFNPYLKNYLENYDTIIGHNIIGFDIPVLEEHLGIDFSKHKIIDTLVLSRLYNPQLEDGHSLKAWGERLKFLKGDHDDWSKLSDEMVTYCYRDLDLTQAVYEWLTKKLSKFEGESVNLEHDVQEVITKQIDNGWLLDDRKCNYLLAELKQRKMELEDEVHEKFKPLPVFSKEITPKFNKDGRLSVVGLKFLGDSLSNVVGRFSRVEWPEFNLGSRQQIARHLQFYGWKPKQFTEKGAVMMDEVILSKVKIPEAQMISEYMMIQKREAQVKSWITAQKEDGRVHGSVNTIGAVTGRMTHSGPNVAQVPASYSPYGGECRSCWTVPQGFKLVGVDASGLELRMLAHYMNDEEYINEVINGDIHTANQRAAGLTSRDNAKTFIYAFLYGAGDVKVGSIIGGTKTDGKRLKEKFLKNTPALKSLKDRVETVVTTKGYLVGLDGRKLIIRSPHSALNTLLQSAGAIIMKKALTTLNTYANLRDIRYRFVGNIHDEIQTEVAEAQAKEFGWLAVECIKDAGIKFNMRCPLDGDYKIGTNWSETH